MKEIFQNTNSVLIIYTLSLPCRFAFLSPSSSIRLSGDIIPPHFSQDTKTRSCDLKTGFRTKPGTDEVPNPVYPEMILHTWLITHRGGGEGMSMAFLG